MEWIGSIELTGTKFKTLLVASGPLLAIITYCFAQYSGVSPQASFVAGLSVWMAFWWMSEAVPIELTALLPIIFVPFSGIHEKGLSAACAPYADKNVYFFLGGFGIGLAIEKSELHRRGALILLKLAGTRASNVVGAFMLATALISMWVNNTATTMLMLPLALSAIAIQPTGRFAAPLLIGIAYASSIGGMATLVGTAPNIYFAGFLAEKEISINFLAWMAVAGPISIILLVGAWIWMVGYLFPLKGVQIEIPQAWRDEIAAAPRLRVDQKWTLLVFCCAAALWMFREPAIYLGTNLKLDSMVWVLKKVEDPWVAMSALVAFLLFPLSKPVLSWSDVERVPWGVLLLLGGGLSLARAIEDSGLDKLIAGLASRLEGFSPYLVLVVLVTVVIAISELASNLATATALIPILSEAGPAMGIDQITLLSAVVMASSCGFMLPVATPPNTLVYAQRLFPARDMIRAGAMVNLLAILIIPVIVLAMRQILSPQ